MTSAISREVNLSSLIAGDAEPAFQFAVTKLGDSNRAVFSDTFNPASLKQLLSQDRSKRAGEMIAPFAPIEALARENATGLS